ncbi:MAG: dihydroorotate dehydrogenase (quinone), partial [Trueperaceae bacterium]|nr:dihydroorotate dehydrogenase (quinone) [Trueperaceae bacterium]
MACAFRTRLGSRRDFDKDAQVLPIWPDARLRIRSRSAPSTPQPQAGDPEPRMFRLPDDEAL